MGSKYILASANSAIFNISIFVYVHMFFSYFFISGCTLTKLKTLKKLIVPSKKGDDKELLNRNNKNSQNVDAIPDL